MARAGQKLLKWTWLMDEVEVTGIVRAFEPSTPEGTPIGIADAFAFQVDPNYQHLVAMFQPGCNPLPGTDCQGCIQVESYSDWNGITPLSPGEPKINRVAAWDLPTKPDIEFFAHNPQTGTSAPLKVGDHVRLVGRWAIENQHEDVCKTRYRGLLYVGCVWAELHPFRWDRIELVVPPGENQSSTEMVSLAVPIYAETYQRGGFFAIMAGVDGTYALVAGRIIVDGQDRAATNTGFLQTFRVTGTYEYDSIARRWSLGSLIWPVGKVTAPDYPDAVINFGLTWG